jgi:hypothetical protein
MPSLDDVYRKFGFAAEAAQLLETELGNGLFVAGAVDADLIDNPDPIKAREIWEFVNRQTLGQLLKSLNRSTDTLQSLQDQLARALRERNRLIHSFYRQHNFRRNSEDGRSIMMKDLESIHDAVLEAYVAVMRLSGVDLEKASTPLPTEHLNIE